MLAISVKLMIDGAEVPPPEFLIELHQPGVACGPM